MKKLVYKMMVSKTIVIIYHHSMTSSVPHVMVKAAESITGILGESCGD